MGFLEFKKSVEWLKRDPVRGSLWLLAFVLVAGFFSVYLGLIDDLFTKKESGEKVNISQNSSGNNSQNIITDGDVTIDLGGKDGGKN